MGALLLTVVGFKIYSLVMVKMGKAEPGSDPLAKVAQIQVSIPETAISDHASCIAGSINLVLAKGRSLFLVENPVETIKFALTLYVLTYVGAWFNALTLVTIAWVALFTLPKIYLNNQPQIDEVMGKVIAQVDEVKAAIVDKLPASMKPAVIKKEE